MRNFHAGGLMMHDGKRKTGIGGGEPGQPCVYVQENRGEPPGLHITDTQITEQTNLTTMPTH